MIEFYQTPTGTKMTVAAERLAVIATVTLPITALSSILGMNVIVHDQTAVGQQLLLVLAVMLIMSGDTAGQDPAQGLVVSAVALVAGLHCVTAT